MAEPNNAVVTRPPSLVALPMSHEEEEEEVLVGSEFVDNATAEVSRDGTNDEEDEDDDDDEDSDDDEKIGQGQYYYSSSSFDLLTQHSVESPFALSFAPSLRGRPSSTEASSSSSFVNVINNYDRYNRVNDSLQQWNALVERQELDAYAVVVDDHLHPFAVPDDLRHSLCDWCYQLVDKWDVNRDAVGTAMSFFDRLLGQVEQSQLYLAVGKLKRGGRKGGGTDVMRPFANDLHLLIYLFSFCFPHVNRTPQWDLSSWLSRSMLSNNEHSTPYIWHVRLTVYSISIPIRFKIWSIIYSKFSIGNSIHPSQATLLIS